MKNLNYNECMKFVKTITQVVVYQKHSGEDLPELIKKYGTKSKLLDISGNDKHALVFPFGNTYNVIYFYKNNFFKEKQITSPLRYQSKNYEVTCYQISLNELIIWLDSYRFMEEKVNISKEDSEILSKHNIQIQKRKTTRKYLYDAYAKTFSSDGKNKDVEKIVDKYCKPIQPLLMVFEQGNEDDIDVKQEDSAIFTRYGFDIPGGKTKQKEIHKKVKDNTINGNLAKIISPEDLEVFKRYGISFSSSGQAQGKVKLPHRSAFYKLKIVAVILLLIGAVFLIWGNQVIPAARYFFTESATRVNSGISIAQVKQEFKEIHEDTYNARELYESINTEFPATLGYIDVHPALLPLIEETEVYVSDMQERKKEAEKLFEEKKHEQLLKILEPYRENHENYTKKLKVIRRILSKLNLTKHINQTLKNEWLREDYVFSILRNLRSYVFSAQDLMDTIAEKQALRNEKYESYKDKIPLMQKLDVEMNIYQQEITKIENVILETETLLARSANFEEIEQFLSPYKDYKSEVIDGLKNIYDAVDQNLQALEILRQKSTSKNEINTIIADTSQKYSQLNTRIQKVETLLLKVQTIPKNLELGTPPPQIEISLENSKQNLRVLRENLSKANQMVDSNQNPEAKELLNQISVDYDGLSEKLRASYDILLEMYQTAKALQVENSKQSKEYSRQLIYIKRQIDVLNDILPVFKAEIEKMDRVAQKSQLFENERSIYKQKLKEFDEHKEQLLQKIESAENLFESKKITLALEEVRGNIDLIQRVTQNSLDAKQFIDEIKTFITNIREQEERKALVNRVNRLIQKLYTYTTKLGEILQPIENNVLRLKEEFPVAEGYQDITPKSRETLTLAKETWTMYKNKLDEAKMFIQQQRLQDALSLLVAYEGKTLSPPNFVEDLKELQNDLSQKLNQAKLKKRGEGQQGIAQEYVDELLERRRNLQKTIPLLQNNILTLKNLYPSIIRETLTFADTDKYIIIGRQEIEEIDELVEEAEELIAAKKYQMVIDFLKPYSTKESSGLSYLPLLQTLHERSQQLLSKVEDPEEKKRLEKELQAKQSKENRLAQLQRSPGTWYDEVNKVISEYEKIKTQIASSLKGGSRFVHSAIEVEIRKVHEYPENIAEIDYIIEFVQANNKQIEKELPQNKRKILDEYLRTKSITVTLNNETSDLLNALGDLKNELRLGGWVEEKTLRTFLRSLQSINRKYSEVHQEIKSPLLNLEAQIPH